MNIILLSGAIKNAGDYLIVQRSKELLKHVYPESKIEVVSRKSPLQNQLEKLNQADVMVFGGGPSYCRNLYPDDIPLVNDLNQIKTKMFFLGAGWYGQSTNLKELYTYQFQKSSMELLNRVSRDSKLLGCRDWYSVKVLMACGIKGALMTGCPAWYNLGYIDKGKLSGDGTIKKILVSDPADMRFFGQQSIELVKFLINKFPDAKIEYVFHRGITKDPLSSAIQSPHVEKVQNTLLALGIPIHDISYGYEGFQIYDDCDLHIGHRVHAHIYNLSIRNRSILLEEDARGAGVNEALGLWPIQAYDRKITSSAGILLKAYNKFLGYGTTNSNAVRELSMCIDYFLDKHEIIYENAFHSMQQYYQVMLEHINSIKTIL